MRILLVFALAACDKPDPLFCSKHADQCNDGGPLDHPDTGDALFVFGSGNYQVTITQDVSGAPTFSGALNTSGSNPCSSSQLWSDMTQPQACFVVAQNITINNVTATGSRPVVFIASDTITVMGVLDVSSHDTANTQVLGPGAQTPPTGGCGGTPPSGSSNGGGGGAGGSFKTKGGDGGVGNNSGVQTAAGTAAAIVASGEPSLLRAGCSGQKGGDGQSVGVGGAGGGGGGAVYLVAGNKLDLTVGAINASGAGGSFGTMRGGGGGGGSGGMIVLYAPNIATGGQTKLIANGGGGAAGANASNQGLDPDPANPTTPAAGGNSGAGCSTNGGGNGAVLTNNGGVGGPGCDGGGGGGGAVGYIQTNQSLGQGAFSPSPTLQ